MTRTVLIGAFQDKQAAHDLAASSGGILVETNKAETAHLPFASLVLSEAGDRETFRDASDVGSYVTSERAIKGASLFDLDERDFPGAIGIFTLVANPDLGPDAADKHWRELHAPLALRIHSAMTHYYQLAVIERLAGPEWHGFALCCFATEDDLRHRFFNSEEGEREIAADIARFADTRESPRRVIGVARRGR